MKSSKSKVVIVAFIFATYLTLKIREVIIDIREVMEWVNRPEV